MGLLIQKKTNQKCAICGCNITEKSTVDNLCEVCYRQTVNVSAILKYLQNTSIENLNIINSASVQMQKNELPETYQTDNFESSGSIPVMPQETSKNDENYYVFRNKTGEKFLLLAGVNKIGKNIEMANIVISDNNTLSRCHARLEKTADGIYLSDCDSKNGTRYNGTRLASGQRVILNSGDSFFLANEALTLIKE